MRAVLGVPGAVRAVAFACPSAWQRPASCCWCRRRYLRAVARASSRSLHSCHGWKRSLMCTRRPERVGAAVRADATTYFRSSQRSKVRYPQGVAGFITSTVAGRAGEKGTGESWPGVLLCRRQGGGLLTFGLTQVARTGTPNRANMPHPAFHRVMYSYPQSCV